MLDQRGGLADPDGTAAPLRPIVEQNAGDLPPFASPGPIAQKPAAAKPNRIIRIITCCRHDIKSRVDRPGACETLRMRFAGVNDALELSVRQEAVSYKVGWQMRPVGRSRRGARCHSRRL